MTESEAASPGLLARLRFAHCWRSYQARVLAALDQHLTDINLHVIAPPGSGKTVLGLEALRRLASPALVLAPTLTIREQWIERLRLDFLAGADPGNGISRDLMQPAELTFATYQGLHSLFREGREQALLVALRERGVRVLAVDEAHHLRSEWWKCLDALRAALPQLHVLALTATPPYDAPQIEWNRYSQFCGEVDEEIGVPELVRDGDLCPHQDLLLLHLPDAVAQAELERHALAARELVAELALDAALAQALAAHPVLIAPNDHTDTLIADPDAWLAVAVFVGNLQWEKARALLEALGLHGVGLPAFDARWAEQLLAALFDPARVQLPSCTARVEELRRRLDASGLLDRRRVHLREHPGQRKLLESADGMLGACVSIVEAERANFGERLRLLMLSDHVRESDFPKPGDVAAAPARLGVVPLFERLRVARLPGLRPAILTGTLVLIPRDTLTALQHVLESECIASEDWRCEPLWHDAAFLRIVPAASVRSRVQHVIGLLFARGDINVLIGTAALLGEGWDAPAVNSLVLASTVAAHVGSNQMRGRAIRVQRGNPGKCANIWHLVGVRGAAAQMPAGADPARDPAARPPPEMQMRFRGFVGLHASAARIESGLQRLGECSVQMPAVAVNIWNARMFAMAARVHELGARWRDALGSETAGRSRLVREARLPMRVLLPHLWVREDHGMEGAHWTDHLPWTLWWRRRSARARLFGAANALAAALRESGLIAAAQPPQVEWADDDALRVSLAHAAYLDQQRFMAALAEMLDPLADPRWLLCTRSRCYAVPAILGRHKSGAEQLAACWRREAGRCELVYTRQGEGRLHLLRVREQALLRRPDWGIEQRSRWLASN